MRSWQRGSRGVRYCLAIQADGKMRDANPVRAIEPIGPAAPDVPILGPGGTGFYLHLTRGQLAPLPISRDFPGILVLPRTGF